jgi:hypothetical protein
MSNEGDAATDTSTQAPLRLGLRSERFGPSASRIYTIGGVCTDGSDNSSTWKVAVTVPHDRRK